MKFEVIENTIIPFVDTFSKIKSINYDDSDLISTDLPKVSLTEMRNMQGENLELKEFVSGGVASIGAGGLAGLAAYGGVGALGTASTGAAIGGLSGVAATNATLAWLGGGSLATGGLGMAGGAAVLGGIVAGPVLAIGGMMAASKAEAAKEDAYSNLSQAKLAAEEMKTASTKTRGIQRRFDEVFGVLTKLDHYFLPILTSFQALVLANPNYSSYSEADKKGVFIAASIAKTLKNILEVDILKGDGSLTRQSKKVVKEVDIRLEKLSSEPVVFEKKPVTLEVLLEEHKELITDNSCMYFGDDIPSKKIKKATSSYVHSDSEVLNHTKPLVLYDDTLFGSAANGFLLTESGFYFKAFLGDEGYFSLKNINSITLDSAERIIHINDVDCSYTYSQVNESIEVIVSCVKEYLEQFK